MTQSSHPSLRWRTAFAVTMVTAMGIGPFAIHGVGALAPLIVPEFGLTRTQLGSLTTVAFTVAAALSVAAGRRVDVLGGRTGLVLLFTTGGGAVALIAAAPSLWWLWLGAVLAGGGLALSNPVTNRLIAAHIPPGRRGLQIGLKQSGVPMFTAVIGFVLPPLAVVLGWRGALLAGIGLVAVGLALSFATIPPTVPLAPDRAAAPRPKLDPVVRWLAAYACSIGIAVQATLAYAPLFAYERVGLPVAFAGMTTGATGAAGMVGRLAWGRITERLNRPIASLVALATVAVASLMLVLASEVAGPATLWPGLLGFGLSAIASHAVVMFAVIRESDSAQLGRASGVASMGLFLGFMIGPVLFGTVVDATDSYRVGWAMAGASCLVALLISVTWQLRSRYGSGDAH